MPLIRNSINLTFQWCSWPSCERTAFASKIQFHFFFWEIFQFHNENEGKSCQFLWNLWYEQWARFKQSRLFLFCKLKCPKLDSCREFSSRFHFIRHSVTFGENVNIWTKESLNNHSLFYQIGFSRLNANEKKNHENNSLTDFKQFKW